MADTLKLTIKRPSAVTQGDLARFLKGSPLALAAAAFVAAEAETGLAADVLVAIACHESGKGTNYWSKPPYNNCMSWGITDSGPVGGKYASLADCVLDVAKALAAILADKGNWRNARALQCKLPADSLAGISTWYASDKDWELGVEGWRQRLIATLDPTTQVMYHMVDVGIFNDPTNSDTPVTRGTLAWALKKGGL